MASHRSEIPDHSSYVAPMTITEGGEASQDEGASDGESDVEVSSSTEPKLYQTGEARSLVVKRKVVSVQDEGVSPKKIPRKKKARSTDNPKTSQEGHGSGSRKSDASARSTVSDLSLAEVQAKMDDWNSITTLEQLKNANLRAITSRIHPSLSYRTGQRAIHVITGKDVLQRREPPERLTVSLLGDYLCLGKGTKGVHSRDKLKSLLSLAPAASQGSPLISAWSLLTKEDTEYQAMSLRQLGEDLIHPAPIRAAIWNDLPGNAMKKWTFLKGFREVMELALAHIRHESSLNQALHGGIDIFDAVWDIIDRVLPEPSLEDSDSDSHSVNLEEPGEQ